MPPRKPLKFLDSGPRERKRVDLAGKLHRHACVECGMSYSCNCTSPHENARCLDCRGKSRPFWDRDYDPRECCVGMALLSEPALLDAYKLAGPGPWFRCRKCGRTNGVRNG